MSDTHWLLRYQTNKTSIFMVLLIGFVSFILSALAPPFVSPDEFAHVTRAYGFSQGKILLLSPPGQNSGVQIDSGLDDYMRSYELLILDKNHKYSAHDLTSRRDVSWSRQEVFRQAPGTGYYFPLIYAPQAVGLGVGRLFNLTIDTSYRLARLLSLVAVVALLITALLLYETPPLVTAFFMLPMTLFQMSSASLDGVSNALAVLAISMYLNLSTQKHDVQRSLPLAFGGTLFILISCRVYLLPMLLMPFALYLLNRQKNYLAIGGVTAVSVCAWLAVAISSTVDGRVSTGASTGTIISYYLQHPLAYFDVLYTTLAAPGNLYSYLAMFLGVLGWLDAPLTSKVYTLLSTFLVLILLFSFSIQDMRQEKVPRLILAFCSVASVFMVFFALLVTWNPHPALLIQGIQGRYFLVPAMLLVYSISPRGKLLPLPRGMALVLLGGLMVYSTYATIKLLLFRYYLYG